VSLAFALVTVACSMSLVASYGLRLGDTVAGTLPATTVVFTGQFDRIEKGIALLQEGRVERLFISGVNRGAGLTTGTFTRQFGLSPALRDGLAHGVIMLATEAQDTVENALETTCWLGRQHGTDPVLLITSQRHMPRASLLLERTSGLRVERLSTASVEADASAFLTPEFWRFVAMWFMTFSPPRTWPARGGFACVPS
jgi:uncharacterized SAM-binding protein YcdF (DUF218 family)